MDKIKTLEKLETLKALIDEGKGFRSKNEFLDWGSKIEPLLGFNKTYQMQFGADLNMIHANLSSQTAAPLADRMRTTLSKGIEQLKHEIDTNDEHNNKIPVIKDYVNQDRIKELRAVSSPRFDLCKLLKICEELNHCNQAQDHLALIMLTRALIDHIPPIFNQNNFSEVVNNYSGTKSFKECMDRLNTASRKIADQHLHTPIRKSEALPTMTQVDFSNEIDVLLAEVFRILKRP